MTKGVNLHSVKVVELNWFSEDLFELVLQRPDLTFTPGDCVSLFMDEGNGSRPYSIASGTCEPVLRFLVRKMDGGVVSSYLATRRRGDRVRCTPPFGWFHPGPNAEGDLFVFVATGVGLAPFLSYMRSHPEQPPACCLYGVRCRQEAVGWTEFADNCPVHLAVSREPVEDAYHGRVTGLMNRLVVTPENHYYLCGLDAMIETVGNWLESQGVEPFNIHREVFFHAPCKQVRLAIHTGR